MICLFLLHEAKTLQHFISVYTYVHNVLAWSTQSRSRPGWWSRPVSLPVCCTGTENQDEMITWGLNQHCKFDASKKERHMRFSCSHVIRRATQYPGVCGFLVTDMSGNRDLITLLAYLLCTARLQFMLFAFLRSWMTWTRQIIKYRVTTTLLRPQIKQYTALNEGRIQNQRNIISFWQWRNVCIIK